MQILDGKALSQQIKNELAEEVQKMIGEGEDPPHLAAVLVGDDGPSRIYVNHKVSACNQCGFKSTLVELDADASEEDLIEAVRGLNNNDDVDGFIVQLPLPEHISSRKVIMEIDPSKDVDGMHPLNVGMMAQHIPAFISATPLGVREMIKRYKIETKGKHVVVVGRSKIVGTPMSILMSRAFEAGDATVTLTHRYTEDLGKYTEASGHFDHRRRQTRI